MRTRVFVQQPPLEVELSLSPFQAKELHAASTSHFALHAASVFPLPAPYAASHPSTTTLHVEEVHGVVLVSPAAPGTITA